MGLNPQRHKPAPHRAVTSSRHWSTGTEKHFATRRLLQQGEHLFHAGEQLKHAYVVRSGSLKSYVIHRDGEEQFLEIHGPGDVLGFDAALGAPANRGVIALDVCSLQPLLHVATSIDAGSTDDSVHTLLMGMYREIGRLTRRLELERHHSERRMAGFLLDLAQRQGRDIGCPTRIDLPVSRRNLAHYLGMAPETVSRTLCGFESREFIQVDNRRIRIVDSEALETMAAGGEVS
ncbi:helix-turn-helix domain-containing protein [Wenzhouxiangella sp. AB-CW3]|uniref:Crp/Fnr family transcriptional regulator n=1 Tax=Wenzhouxiangella sp. AB-CW3 TaxID=2771012 RepID=UPI00168B6825|nr:helix-turn-helix domain-containing protein [Wenzhouxiangella sp. AB-CW3]QOC22472.1 helix-turn-helix domain-containing protein [Wenzhouxiangella sp. AB-CW3]